MATHLLENDEVRHHRDALEYLEQNHNISEDEVLPMALVYAIKSIGPDVDCRT